MKGRDTWADPAMNDRLRQLWAEGYSAGRIGDLMGLSKNQVIGRVHRLQLPQRQAPAALQNVKDKPRVLSSARLGAAGVGGSRLAPAAQPSLAGNGSPLPGPRAAAGTALVSLAGNSGAGASRPRPQLFPVRGCQFPLWKHGERPAFDEVRYCDAPARRNESGNQDSPYCAAHHAKCFVQPVKKVAA